MKKARIFFVLCLVAALTIGLAVTASAAEETQYIDVIWIEMEQPVGGTTIPEAAIPADSYNIILGKSEGENSFSHVDNAIESIELKWGESGEFQDGSVCGLNISIELKNGYQFFGATDLFFNCKLVDTREINSASFNSAIQVEVQDAPRAQVWINSLPEATAGKTAEAYGYTDGENDETPRFEITGSWYIYNYATQTSEAFTGTFEDGKLYQLKLNVKALNGYVLANEYAVVDLAKDSWYYADTHTATEMTVTVPFACGEMDTISNVWVSGIPSKITAGQTAGAVTLTTDNAANLSARWMDAEGNPFTGTFEEGKVYYLSVTVTPKAGVYLDESLSLYNNENGHCIGSNSTNGVSATINVRYSLVPKVDKVEITGVTDAVIGQAPTVEGIKVPEGANYEINNVYWENQTNWEDELTVFADGNKYVLYINIDVAEGYEFTEDTVVTVNGEVVEEPYIGHAYIEIPLTYSFLKQIDKVDITVPAPEIGQTATLDGIVLPEGLELDTNDSYWYENVTEVIGGENHGVQKIVEGAFQKGHKYYLYLNFYVKAGYEFTDDAEIYCNGNLADGYNETYGNLWESVGYLETCYSFREIIHKVEITGVPTPAVGQTATTEGIKITGVGEYEIYWIEEDSEDGEPFTGTFETGKAYYLRLAFDSAEGTEFGDNCVITVNGEKKDNGWTYSEGGDISLRYSFKQVIDKIEITGLPQFSVGGTASVAGLKAPDGANYTVIGQWGDMTGDDGDSFTGTFVADGVYILYIGAEPKEGYEFAEDLQILVDGKAPATTMFYSYTDSAVVVYYYVPSYEEMGKLELTVKDPVIGETFKSGDIETPEGVKYSLYGDWFVSEDGESWRRVSSGTFEAGKYYALALYVELRSEDDEIWFGNNPQASVNGVNVVWDNDENYASFSYVRVMQKFSKLCAHTYGDWTSVDGKTHSKTCTKCGNAFTEDHAWTDNKDEKCDICGYDRSDNPHTGDAVIPAALLALCSVTALVVIKRRRVR